jgi:hypothetical protein
MATLVLTVVGSAVGGPVGGAIGAAIGQQIDNIIFAPKGREGPRLKELEVQTSSYGTPIPAIFGAMRVAGTVIWATDLIERKSKKGGGKGKPSTTQYSYSVSMAVAISSRRVARIGRIWADGNLLRGEGGDFKVETGFRLYSGDDDQPVDPLIASAEATGQSPAYRGLAYAMFEDLQLADYGNRIPSLTFEVFERETPVPLNAIFQAASSNAVAGASSETVIGYAMSGADARAAVSPLLDNFPVMLRSNDGRLELLDTWRPAASLSEVAPVAQTGDSSHDRPVVALAPVYTAPQSLSLRYYEPMRDFQTGLQESGRSGGGRLSQQIDLPAAMSAAGAKRLVELNLLQKHRGRESWSAHMAVGSDAVSAGQWVTDPSGRAWKITEIEHLRGAMRISATASLPADPSLIPVASPGRAVESPDLTPGLTEIAVIDLPVFDSVDSGKILTGIFANGTGNGWRSAALSVQQADQLVEIGGTAAPAIIGRSVTPLGAHTPHLLDSRNVLEVQLAHDDIEFDRFASGAAIGWLGGEFIGFDSVTALGGGRYRLANLRRGCFGSEAAIGGHLANERFVVIENDSVRLLDTLAPSPGATLIIEALGLGDVVPVLASTQVTGKAIAPLPPVHASGRVLPSGGIELQWIRRSRIDFGWNDGVDQALVEDGELYSVSLAAGGEIVGSWTSTENRLILSPATAADLVLRVGPNLTFMVRQLGRHMQSMPTIIDIIV